MRVIHAPREFVALESAVGILLAIAAAAALVFANSPLAFLYDAFVDTPTVRSLHVLDAANTGKGALMQTLRVSVRSGLGSGDLAPTPPADAAMAGRAVPFGSSAASQGRPA